MIHSKWGLILVGYIYTMRNSPSAKEIHCANSGGRWEFFLGGGSYCKWNCAYEYEAEESRIVCSYFDTFSDQKFYYCDCGPGMCWDEEKERCIIGQTGSKKYNIWNN